MNDKTINQPTWLGRTDGCDICHDPLDRFINKMWFVDGRTKAGIWTLMCPRCFEHYGIGLGSGKGQKYDFVSKVKIEG